MGYWFNKISKPGTVGILLLLIIFVLTATLSGCGQQASKDQSTEESSQGPRNSDFVKFSDLDAEGMQFAEYDSVISNTAQAAELERKVIYNADMTVEVSEVEKSLNTVLKICQDNGGYTVSSKLSKDDDWTRGVAEIKVPADKLEACMAKIGELGEVTDRDISSEDVTEEYYDAQTRLDVLQKKEERLLALFDQASTIEEIISVESELGQVRADIEVLQGRLKYLSNMTEYSSISVILKKAVPEFVNMPEGTLGKAGQAFINSINSMVDFVSGSFIWLIGFIPWGIFIAIIYFVLRALKRKYNLGFKRLNKHKPSIPSEHDINKE